METEEIGLIICFHEDLFIEKENKICDNKTI